MNETKLNRLLAAARREAGPAGPADFAGDVLCAVRREPPPGPLGSASLWEQLSGWCPRLAAAAVLIIVLCGVADQLAERMAPADSGDLAAQFSSANLTDGEEL